MKGYVEKAIDFVSFFVKILNFVNFGCASVLPSVADSVALLATLGCHFTPYMPFPGKKHNPLNHVIKYAASGCTAFLLT
jgi:hypothetical protein